MPVWNLRHLFDFIADENPIAAEGCKGNHRTIFRTAARRQQCFADSIHWRQGNVSVGIDTQCTVV